MNHRPFTGGTHTTIDGVNYMYLNLDNPFEAYNNSNISFVAQPSRSDNHRYNNIVVPLMMGDMWDIIKEDVLENGKSALLEDIRKTDKKYKFGFIGAVTHSGRRVLRDLKLDSYLLEEAPNSIYKMPDKADVRKEIVRYLKRVAECSYIISPRGIGSSSFRTYEAMSVGSIPLVMGMVEYPFENEINWDDMCIRGGELSELDQLLEKAQMIDDHKYDDMREAAIKFWDGYCRHDALYSRMRNIIKNTK